MSEAISIENQAHQLMGRLLAVVENYPELKANENYMHVQKTLVEIEEQISAGRRIFNNEVTVYNNEVEVFPNVVVAKTMGFIKMPWFEVDAAQIDPPKI
jgi:LemA protein